MKVLLLNGSPRAKGCTYTGLVEMAGELEKQGIETEIVHVGKKAITGCVACMGCRKVTPGRCVFTDDGVNAFLDKVEEADGVVFGSPVHFAGVPGTVKSFLDRVFYAGAAAFRGKPAAVMASVRRGGSTATLDGLMKYPAYGEMLIASGRYWNMIHGNTPDEVKQDLEGMENLRFVGQNMTWLLKSLEAGKQAGIKMPEAGPKMWTNFIR